MLVVIIAGGSGTRLWPLSQPTFPKHLLSLTGNSSLLQTTVARAGNLAKPEDIYIVSAASHIEHIYSQLPHIPKENIIIEPDRRGTAHCVIGALAHLKNTRKDDEQIIFMHADHHIANVQGFYNAIRLGGRMAASERRIVLLGVQPTFPATGFGYIEKSTEIADRVFKVTCFKEKPDEETARTFVESGRYLWNMGYFIAPLSVFETEIQNYAPEIWQRYQALVAAQGKESFNEIYLNFDTQQIDVAVNEKIPELLVVTDDFEWCDVGSYGDLHTIRSQDQNNNTISGQTVVMDTSNSLIENLTQIPLAVIGLDNVVVVATDKGLLVTNKKQSQKVGEASKLLTSAL